MDRGKPHGLWCHSDVQFLVSYPKRWIRNVSLHILTTLSYPSWSLLLIDLSFEKTLKHILVLSAFYPEDYLWYTTNKSYEWFIHYSLIYPLPQAFIQTLSLTIVRLNLMTTIREMRSKFLDVEQWFNNDKYNDHACKAIKLKFKTRHG